MGVGDTGEQRGALAMVAGFGGGGLAHHALPQLDRKFTPIATEYYLVL